VRVQLGNSAAKEAYRDDKGLHHRDVDGSRVTTIVIPDSYTLIEAVSAVTAQDGAWNHHSQGDDPGDSAPDWVESDNDALAQLLAGHFDCPIGRPKGWKDVTETSAKGGESDPR
jgi:hypothetical protein